MHSGVPVCVNIQPHALQLQLHEHFSINIYCECTTYYTAEQKYKLYKSGLVDQVRIPTRGAFTDSQSTASNSADIACERRLARSSRLASNRQLGAAICFLGLVADAAIYRTPMRQKALLAQWRTP